jgi:4-amino-4-deoxy-L-arabinose transferase-like glycosyltransferase
MLSVISISIAVITFLIYLRTLAPGVYGFDSAELATGVVTLGIVHPPGYPLYLLLGKVFTFLPIRDPAYRLNLMSAFWAALCVPILFLINLRLFGSRLAALAGAALFAFSIYTWKMAVVAEVYSLENFLVAFSILMLVLWDQTGKDRFLAGAALGFGLCLTNHTTEALLAPGLGLWVIRSKFWNWKRARWILTFLGLCLLPLALYAYIPIRASAHPELNYIQTYYPVDPTTLKGVFWMISGQAYRFFAFGYPLDAIPAQVAQFLGFLSRNFLGIGVIFGIIGIIVMWLRQRPQMLSLLLMFAMETTFFINYRVLDKDTMFLPAYLIWAILVSGGIAWLLEVGNTLGSIRIVHPPMVKMFHAFFVFCVTAPIVLNWSWTDYSTVTGPRDFAQEVFRIAPKNAEIVAEWSPAVVLEYYQIVENQRTDIKIYNLSRSSVARFYTLWLQNIPAGQALDTISQEQNAYIQQEIGCRPVYAVNYDPDLAKNFEYLPAYNVFELRKKTENSGPAGNSFRSGG